MLSSIEPGGIVAGTGARFQSYGAVVIVDEQGVICHVSQGCSGALGLDDQELLGEPVSRLLPNWSLATLADEEQDPALGPAWRIAALEGGAEVKVRSFAAAEGLTGLDVIPFSGAGSRTEAQTVERIMRWTARLQSTQSVAELLHGACATAVALSGFEGVWGIRIDDGGDGFVEAAAVSGGAPDTTGSAVSAINLPPGDLRVAQRPVPFFVADVTEPANDLTPAAGQLDLSGSALHRPYDEYLGFLASFGVRSAYSVPVVAGGKTWARLIGHHPASKVLGAGVQSELRLLGLTTGVRLQELLDARVSEQQARLAMSTVKVMRAIAATGALAPGLTANPIALLELCAASSAVVSTADEVQVVGEPLTSAAVEVVLKDARLKLAAAKRGVVASATMPFSEGGYAGGYLAMSLDDAATDIVVWVRPERRRTVQWVAVDGSGSDPDRPRAISDSITSVGRDESSSSAPWDPGQLDAVEAFRNEMAGLMMSRYGALSRVNSDLQRSNAEFDAFAHTIAHDLRAPIRGIMLHTEFFLEDTADRLTPAEVEQLRTVLRLAGRGTDLLGDLLRYAQLGEATWTTQPCDLPTTAAQAIEQLDHNLTATADITIGDGQLTADPSALRQLLANLIGNALKYSGATPRVGVSLTTLGHAKQHSALPGTIADAADDAAVLVVRDNGVGIPAEHHQRVFELFKRANQELPDVAGTGAGLAMCRRIALRHGGDIWLTSEPGQGTTVYALLHA